MHSLFQRTITSLFLIPLFLLLLLAPVHLTSCAIASILVYILIAEWPRFFKKTDIFLTLLTPLYPILPFVLLVLLNESPHRFLLLSIIILVCTYDTGAYLAGNLFGRCIIAPSISPGKTWEGFVGGYCCTFIVATIFSAYTTVTHTPLSVFVICALATAGDFFESYLKRRAGLKDSGNLLPGHGGVLDRVDGLLFVVVYIFCKVYYLRV
jgi:phosphatidate cytidylyltransferase